MGIDYLVYLSLVAFGFIIIGICLLLTYIQNKIYKKKLLLRKVIKD